MMHGLFDTTIQTLDKALELRSQKLQVISSNIANAETPGYAPMRMDFEKSLQEAVSGPESGQVRTHQNHMPAAGGKDLSDFRASFYRDYDRSGIGDRNKVSIEQEMVDLSENQIRYEAAIQMLNKKFSMLKLVIQERT